MPESPTFSSKAWLLDGPIHSLPGILHFESRQVAYLALDQGTFSEARFQTLLATLGTVVPEGESTFPLQLFSISSEAIDRFHMPWCSFGARDMLTSASANQLRALDRGLRVWPFL